MKKLIILLSFFFISCVNAKDGPKFPDGELNISGQKLKIEIADTDELREHGLMYRKSLDEGKAMLFIFPTEEPRVFWMKNTFIPLSIGYFDKDKKLIEVIEMQPVKSEMQVDIPRYPSSKPAKFALEAPKGWFSKHKVKPGATFDFKKH